MKDSSSNRKRERYRRVAVRMWGDEKFRALTPIPPCGQGLWLFLMTGQHTGPIPGLFRAGRAALAEELNWSLEAFDHAMSEAIALGMAEADWKSKVVLLPNAIKYNQPESLNVVKSWKSEFDLIPECELKWKAATILRASIGALGKAFSDACDMAFCMPSAKPKHMSSPMPCRIQDQEQDKTLDTVWQSTTSTAEPGSEQPAENPEQQTKAERKAQRIAAITADAVEAFNRILARPTGQLSRVSLINDTRRREVSRCLKTASAICSKDFGGPEITPAFWESYFTECSLDEFMSGRRRSTGEHQNWRPDFEYLTREKTMTKVYDRAVTENAA